MAREEGMSSFGRGVGPNVFRAVLMNASQLASYDFFKAELLKTKYFEDNIYCHFMASLAAVSISFIVYAIYLFALCDRELLPPLSAPPPMS